MYNFKIFIYNIYIYTYVLYVFSFSGKTSTNSPLTTPFPYFHPRFTQITASPEDILLSFLAGSFEASAVSIQLLLEGLCGLLLEPRWMLLGFGSSWFLQDHLILRNSMMLYVYGKPWDIPKFRWFFEIIGKHVAFIG